MRARGPVLSVLLFSRRPPAALGGALVSVTPETSTSIRLLRLLLDVRRGLEGVRYVRGLEPSQARRAAHDRRRAMRMRDQRPEGFTHTLDLGADWLEWTGLVVRVRGVGGADESLDPAIKRELTEFLDASLAAGLAHLPEIARQQTEPGWSADEIEAYLRRFHYRLGPRIWPAWRASRSCSSSTGSPRSTERAVARGTGAERNRATATTRAAVDARCYPPGRRLRRRPRPARHPRRKRPMATMHEIDYEIVGDDMQFVKIELDPGEAVGRRGRHDDVHRGRHPDGHRLRRRLAAEARASWAR